MQIFNQYSAVFSLILPLGLLAAAIVWRRRPFLSRSALIIGLLLLVSVGYFLLQPEANSVASDQALALLDAPSGQPVFIELYSDY